jgi:hypothetical protein
VTRNKVVVSDDNFCRGSDDTDWDIDSRANGGIGFIPGKRTYYYCTNL